MSGHKQVDNEIRYRRLPSALAWLLACATFPLIWVGGLVTTYEAGMAVPDWPGTYGYNLFLYPLESWWTGPFDLFVEHGHRLLGATVGIITILVMASVWSSDKRTWVRWFSVITLGAVIAQGAIGGARVLLNADTLARLHGCTGPIFFALAICLVTFLSRRWFSFDVSSVDRVCDGVVRTGWLMVFAAYVQLVLGANLRHPSVNLSPMVFRSILIAHLVLAAVVTILAIQLAYSARRTGVRWIQRPAWLLLALVCSQIALGLGTWVVKHSWPTWAESIPGTAGFVVQAQSFQQAFVITGHVAVGSLIIVTSLMVALRATRVVWLQSVADRKYANAESTIPNSLNSKIVNVGPLEAIV